MIFPTFAVVIGALLVVCDAGFTETLAKAKAVLAKSLNGADAPDAFAKKPDGFVRKAAVSPDTTTYVSAGWLVQTYYTGDSCSSPLFGQGYAVDTCYLNNGLGFKYQLVDGSCTGAVRQDFSDADCTTLTDTTSMDAPTGCESSPFGISFRATCSADSTPNIPFQSVTLLYYREADCQTVGSLAALPTNVCFGQGKYQCSGDSVTMVMYDGTNCEGTATPTTVTGNMCFTNDDDDDSPDDDDDDDAAYYNVGQNATTYTMECLGNSASSLAGSLGAKAVLAVVLGAAAFLSM